MDNYYSNQIRDYLVNYQNALSEIDKLNNWLNDLYASFSSASGADIAKIRNDIEIVSGELTALKIKIQKAKIKTKDKAESADRCFQKYYNADYQVYETGDRKYAYGARVYIENDGLIHVVREYTRKQSFLESIFMSNAGEYYDDKIISKEEMFNN